MPDPQMVVAIASFVAFLLVCHVVGCLIVLAVRVNVPGVTPPYPLLGCAALGIQLWAYGFAHIPWNLISLLVPWAIASLLFRRSLIQTLRAQAAAARSVLRRIPSVDPLVGGLIAISALLVIAYTLNLLLHPVTSWDGVAFWFFKAKLYFVDQHVDPASSALASIPQLNVIRTPEYPPLFPLMVASTFVFSGSVNESLGTSLNLLCLIAVAPTLYSLLRPLLGLRLAVLLVFLFAAIPAAAAFLVDGSYFGYADYVEACWLVLALIYVQAGERAGGTADVMAIACASAAALTKPEGTPLLGFVLAVLIVRRAWQWRQWRVLPPAKNIVLAGVSVLPVIVWHFTWLRTGTITPLMLNSDPLALLPDLPSRAATILGLLGRLPSRHNIDIWLALAVPLSLLLLAFDRFRTGRALAAAFTLQLVTYFAVYLFDPLDLVPHFFSSSDRVVMQLTPAVILLLGVGLSSYVATGRLEAQPVGVPLPGTEERVPASRVRPPAVKPS
jgi:hypothetical protein